MTVAAYYNERARISDHGVATAEGKDRRRSTEGPSSQSRNGPERERDDEGEGGGWTAREGREETGVYVRQTSDDA